MKKKGLILAICLLGVVGCGEKQELENKEDQKVAISVQKEDIKSSDDVVLKEDGKYYDKKNDQFFTGKIKIDIKAKEGVYMIVNVKDGLLDREDIMYDKDKKVLFSGNYNNGEPDGKFVYNVDGIQAEGIFSEGKPVGEYKLNYKDDSGDYNLTINYKDGKLEGSDITITANGSNYIFKGKIDGYDLKESSLIVTGVEELNGIKRNINKENLGIYLELDKVCDLRYF